MTRADSSPRHAGHPDPALKELVDHKVDPKIREKVGVTDGQEERALGRAIELKGTGFFGGAQRQAKE